MWKVAFRQVGIYLQQVNLITFQNIDLLKLTLNTLTYTLCNVTLYK